jgi:acyl-CoA thioester hydrolase
VSIEQRGRLGAARASLQAVLMANRVFEQSIVIREGHLDTFGHVNNARYLEIFEQARWDFINDNGFGLDFVKSSGTGPVILELSLRFVREVKNRQHMLIRSFLDSYEGKIGRLTQQLIDDSDQVCCEGKFVIAQWDTNTRKLILPTPEWRRAIGLD